MTDRKKLREWAEQQRDHIDPQRFMQLNDIIGRLPEFKGPLPERTGKTVLMSLAWHAVRILTTAPPEATTFFRHILNTLLGVVRRPPELPGMPDYEGPLGSTRQVTRIMESLQGTLVSEFGCLPDAVLILRVNGGDCRTLFAANPENFDVEENPRAVMAELLEEAAAQNRDLINDVQRGGTA